jgi:serine/threonine protein kinase
LNHPRIPAALDRQEDPMTDPVSMGARAAAERLSPEYGPGIVGDVEAALTRGLEQRPERHDGTVSLGSLIVSIATLAWTIYIDLRKKTPNPASDVVARSVRVELRKRGDTDTTSSDHISDVVVTEVINAAGDTSAGSGSKAGELGGEAGGSLARLRPGSEVAGYRLERQIGAGGLAVVYRARDERLNRLVALKLLPPALANDDFPQRFLQESQAAAAVDDPHIVPVYEAGEADGVPFIAMQFIPGGDVGSLVRRLGPLPPARAAAIISSVASALDTVHAAGVVHRDVKPANILLDTRPGQSDHVYLSDFGLSKVASSMTGTGPLVGTPDYVSPEQLTGARVDGRTDQYALACTAFVLLTGTPPFRGDHVMAIMYAQVHMPPPQLTSLRPDLAPEVDQVFARALAKDPGSRYESCQDFADALATALSLAPPGPGPGADVTLAFAAESPGDPHLGDAATPQPSAPELPGDPHLEHEGVGGITRSDATGLPPVRRYLLGRFPDSARPGRVFSVLVSVVRSVGLPPEGGAPLSPFEVPAGGRHLALVLYAPGLRVVDDHRQTVLVPPSGDSQPAKFDLIGDDVGLRRISVTAWDGGSYLGELIMEISVERDGPARPDRTAIGEAREGRTDGEVTLLVRYDPHQRAYRFEFIDVDYPEEVTSQLVYDPGPAVERLVRRLGALAEGTAGYSAAATRAYLVNEGVTLWQELVPEQLRSQFWERQRRITQLTILTNHDVVPWELLYPKDRRHDAGFLVEQFPVTRAIYGHARQRRLQLHPARFVVPPGSPADAQAEAHALAGLLGTPLTTVSELMPLLQLIGEGRFGLLHFACHNRFDPDDGSSIRLDTPFTPTFLAIAASDQTLTSAAPVVFINACRSAGEVASYNQLDGWAEKFLHAGAAAFIGSLWDVCDGTAREFAQELYRRLVAGDALGVAVMAARREVAAEPGDPTWLAYAVYGDPLARVDLAAR